MNDIANRLLIFSTDVFASIRTIDRDPLLLDPKRQLVRASSSPGANYAEAQSAISRKDFHNKIRISLKEMRETRYWLQYFKIICDKSDHLDNLLKESE